jgi:hypothetical protein
MINFFRKIRKKMADDNRPLKYFSYAIGEIVLVVIGILIALQINNWNEQRKSKELMLINIQSIKDDIKADKLLLNKIINSLNNQIESGNYILPIMESEEHLILDSLKFILSFNEFTTTPIISDHKTTWDYLSSSGVLSEFPDPKLLNMLQNYYNDFNGVSTNFTNSANPGRLELRKLKYELFTDMDHKKFFPTKSPEVPNKKVYTAIFNDKRVLPLCRFISSTAIFFDRRLMDVQKKADSIIKYLDQNYKHLEQ